MRFALTYDDAPGPSMSALLDLLSVHGAKATFFVIGRNVEVPLWPVSQGAARQLLVRAIEEGHDLGNHSYEHASRLNGESFAEEVARVDQLIRSLREEAAGDVDSPILLRLPYGEQPRDPRAVAMRAHGRHCIQWTAIAMDWEPRDPVNLANMLIDHLARMEETGKDALLAMHIGGAPTDTSVERPWTVEATRLLLEGATSRGWECVPCPSRCDLRPGAPVV